MTRPQQFLVSSATLLCLLIASPQLAHALEIQVTPQGEVLFFEDGVLGETTEKNRSTAPSPTKRFAPAASNRVTIQPIDSDVKLKVTNDMNAAPGTMPAEKVEVDSAMTKRVRAQFPAQLNETQIQRIEEKQPEAAEAGRQRATDAGTPSNLLEERKTRTDQVEVKSRLDEAGDQELEIKSGSAKARVKNGAQFSIDTETNTMMLTTPSGQEKTLNHLPDQALEKMRQHLVIENTDPEREDFTIETTEDGKVFYHTKGIQRKKFLGIFDRPIETEVVLDDETGEVAAVEQASPGILGQFLDVFTF